MQADYSNKIRAHAEHQYVVPARREGRRKFAIRVRDVLNTMVEREDSWSRSAWRLKR